MSSNWVYCPGDGRRCVLVYANYALRTKHFEANSLRKCVVFVVVLAESNQAYHRCRITHELTQAVLVLFATSISINILIGQI